MSTQAAGGSDPQSQARGPVVTVTVAAAPDVAAKAGQKTETDAQQVMPAAALVGASPQTLASPNDTDTAVTARASLGVAAGAAAGAVAGAAAGATGATAIEAAAAGAAAGAAAAKAATAAADAGADSPTVAAVGAAAGAAAAKAATDAATVGVATNAKTVPSASAAVAPVAVTVVATLATPAAPAAGIAPVAAVTDTQKVTPQAAEPAVASPPSSQVAPQAAAPVVASPQVQDTQPAALPMVAPVVVVASPEVTDTQPDALPVVVAPVVASPQASSEGVASATEAKDAIVAAASTVVDVPQKAAPLGRTLTAVGVLTHGPGLNGGVLDVDTNPLGGWRVWPQLQQIIAGITFATTVKAACMAGNVLVQVSPYPQVKRWSSRGCTGESDPAPYVSIAFGGWQWCYYGLFAWWLTKRSGFLILVHSNCLGALLGTYYTLTFYRNCRHDSISQGLQKYLTAVATLALFQVCTLMVLPAERALFLTGLIASFCSFVGALSMLVSVPTVVRTEDSRIISGPLAASNFMSAAVWVVCGWMLSDPLIGSPNVVAVLASGTCLYLKSRYPASDEDGDEFQKPVEFCQESQALQPLPSALKSKNSTLSEYATFPNPFASTFTKAAKAEVHGDCGGTF